MRAVSSRNTAPELLVRKLLFSLGYRYRLHRSDLPGKPDLVFSARKKVIFVHGCFWHQHPSCKRAKAPSSNISFWDQKLTRNVERDRQVQDQLMSFGWECLVLWECEITDQARLTASLRRFLGAPRADRSG
jgi:DNA mismatch endonuclease (patch repair protein)